MYPCCLQSISAADYADYEAGRSEHKKQERLHVDTQSKRNMRLDYRKEPFCLFVEACRASRRNLQAEEICRVKGESSSEK